MSELNYPSYYEQRASEAAARALIATDDGVREFFSNTAEKYRLIAATFSEPVCARLSLRYEQGVSQARRKTDV
jgi:hypothetical protein